MVYTGIISSLPVELIPLYVIVSLLLAFGLNFSPTSALLAQTGTCGHCGTERWPIKTLTDPGAGTITAGSPVALTISALIDQGRQQAPEDASSLERRAPFERQLVRVLACLHGFKQEHDQDYHLVISAGPSLIAEIPSPNCDTVCSTRWGPTYAAERAALESRYGAPHGTRMHWLRPAPLVVITGVPFYDFDHGQTDRAQVASNTDVEVHPVTSLHFVGTCR